jgi:uncharacterized membrane protein YdjX (TVP38/TMEM64 family)
MPVVITDQFSIFQTRYQIPQNPLTRDSGESRASNPDRPLFRRRGIASSGVCRRIGEPIEKSLEHVVESVPGAVAEGAPDDAPSAVSAGHYEFILQQTFRNLILDEFDWEVHGQERSDLCAPCGSARENFSRVKINQSYSSSWRLSLVVTPCRRLGKLMRVLILPAAFFGVSAVLVWIFGERIVFPEDTDGVVTWLRSHHRHAWVVGSAVILGDALLPMPSAPAMYSMGIIYGSVIGGFIGGAASVIAGLIGFGATRALGRRGAIFLVGEKDLQRMEGFYERWGLYAVAFGRAVGGPAEWAVILAGLSRMPFLQVLGALCIGGFASGFVMAALGAMAVTQPLLATAITVGLLIAALYAARLLVDTSRSAS